MHYGSRYYDFVVTLDGYVVIFARHPRAKQVIIGWAGDHQSTKDRGAVQLYGNEAEQFRGDWTNWKWKLDAYGVRSLRLGLRTELAAGERFDSTAFDQRRAKELLHGIEAALAARRALKVQP